MTGRDPTDENSLKEIIFSPFKIIIPLWAFAFITIPVIYKELGSKNLITLTIITLLVISIFINIKFYLNRKSIIKEFKQLKTNRDALADIHENLIQENDNLKENNIYLSRTMTEFLLNNPEYRPTIEDTQNLVEIACGRENLNE